MNLLEDQKGYSKVNFFFFRLFGKFGQERQKGHCQVLQVIRPHQDKFLKSVRKKIEDPPRWIQLDVHGMFPTCLEPLQSIQGFV